MELATVSQFGLAVAIATSFTKFPFYYLGDTALQNNLTRLWVFVEAFLACLLFDPVLHGPALEAAKQAGLDAFKVGLAALVTYHALTLNPGDIPANAVIVGQKRPSVPREEDKTSKKQENAVP